MKLLLKLFTPLMAHHSSVEKVADNLEEVLMVSKLPKESESMDLDLMEEHCCKAMDKLSVKKVNNMYARYQEQWKVFVRKKKVKDEYNDIKLLEFFKSIRNNYSPSTLWVIYSCLNSYFIDEYGKNLKNLPRLG